MTPFQLFLLLGVFYSSFACSYRTSFFFVCASPCMPFHELLPDAEQIELPIPCVFGILPRPFPDFFTHSSRPCAFQTPGAFTSFYPAGLPRGFSSPFPPIPSFYLPFGIVKPAGSFPDSQDLHGLVFAGRTAFLSVPLPPRPFTRRLLVLLRGHPFVRSFSPSLFDVISIRGDRSLSAVFFLRSGRARLLSAPLLASFSARQGFKTAE